MYTSIFRHFTTAANAAQESDMTWTLGACLVAGGKTLTTGFNHSRCCAQLKTCNFDPALRTSNGKFLNTSIHAEVATLLKLKGRFEEEITS